MEGERKDLFEAARLHFVTAGYGKFDLIQSLLPGQVLFHSRPRLVKKIICEKFDMQAEEINDDTLWSWLRRIRKDIKRNASFDNMRAKPTDTENDWQHFIPSVPKSDLNETDSIIKLVTS